jgi:3-oxoacyl-[acyl-carrier-protein] synthase II
MGAAGAIETAFALHSLAERLLPPTVGLRQPEPAAAGRVSAAAQPLAAGPLLSTNSGFGGINAALVLGGAETA